MGERGNRNDGKRKMVSSFDLRLSKPESKEKCDKTII